MVSGEVIESRAPTVQEIAEFSSALSPDLAGFDPRHLADVGPHP